MRKALALSLTTASVVALALAAPANAAECTAAELLAANCTTVSLTVVDGALSIATTPAAAGVSDPVTGSLGTSTTISLGATTVIDSRLSSTGWIAKATSTPFTASAGGGDDIPVTAHKFFVGSVTTLPTNTTLAYSDGTNDTTEAPVASGANLVTATSTGPSLTVVYTPSMRVAVPAGQFGGLYTATVTQSVS